MSFDLRDIKRVQEQRPDLDDVEAQEVLGFLTDVYAVEPYSIPSDKLFKTAADMMYPLERTA